MTTWFISLVSALALILGLIPSGSNLAAEKVRIGTALKGVIWMELPMVAA